MGWRSLGLQRLDVEQRFVLVVDLQGGVLDLEGVVDEPVHRPAGDVAVGVLIDGHVGGEGGEAGGDFPDVEVVDFDDAGLGGEGLADGVGVDPLRCGFEEDAPGGFHQSVAGVDHQPGDQERDDRVGAVKAGEKDHAGGDRGSDERVEVGEDVLEGAFDVQALAVGLRQRVGRGEIDGDAGQRDGEDQSGGRAEG